jgi:biotin operon repressor
VTHREQVLEALRAAGPAGVSNGYLNRLGIFRYSARIHELRDRGFEIRTVNGKGGLATFYLTAEPSPPSVAPPPVGSLGGGEQAALFEEAA